MLYDVPNTWKFPTPTQEQHELGTSANAISDWAIRTWDAVYVSGTLQTLSDVIDRAARQIKDCQDPVVQSYINQPGVIEVLLDHVRVAIMDHCNLPYPEYVPAPWPKVAKYLAPATVEALGIIPPHHRNLSYAVALELIDPDFDDTF